jgi:hypothetical protein
MLLNILAISALFGSSAFAWRWGGFDERLASIAFILATGASQIFTNRIYGNVETAVLLIDACLLAGLVVLALRSDRFWPMWAAAFQLVGTSVHFASMTETGDFAWAYAVGLIFWSYPVLIALIVGTWMEARHRQRWVAPAE